MGGSGASRAFAAAPSGEAMTGTAEAIDEGPCADVRRRLGSGFTRRSVVISGTLKMVGEPAYIV